MPDGYVTIASFTTGIDAELSRMKLDAQDIPVCLLDSQMMGVQPLYGAAIQVRLQVPVEDAERAREILADGEQPNIVDEEFLSEEEEAVPPPESVKNDTAEWSFLKWTILIVVAVFVYVLMLD